MTIDAHDGPDWDAMREREIATGIGHGLDPDSAAAAADDVIAFRQEIAGRAFAVTMALDEPKFIDNSVGELIGMDPGRWERGVYVTDDTGGITAWKEPTR